MLRATSVIRKPAVKPAAVIDTVVLSHEERQRRRISLTALGGLTFLLDLDKATALNEGDALKLEDGTLVQVHAAAQSLLEIRAENPLRLMRVAWHIGNRHTPAELTADAIYIEDDHVLAEMVRGQGCLITKVSRPFKPERGAYEGGHGHDHGHAHSHDHGHPHDHDHGHAHDHGHDHAHAHAHGDDCGCGHDHHHGPEHTHDVLKVASPKAHDHGHKHDHQHGHDHDHGHAHHHHGHDHHHPPGAKHDH
jgi:urease accessory protein